MPELEPKSTDSELLEKLLKENLELNKKIYKNCKKTQEYIYFVKAFNVFKFILIFIPVIIAILYLIPLVGDFIGMYKEFFSKFGEAMGILNNLKEIQQITP